MSIKSTKVMDLNELLILIHRAGYMRCIELSQFTKKELPLIDKMVQALLNQRYIISRTFPKEAGDAYYLSSRGASHLQQHGVQVTKIYKLDEFVHDEWKHPNDWEHHFMCLGAISHLIDVPGGPLPYFFEREVKRAYPGLNKYPDGILVESTTSGTWLEIENAPKTGAKLEQMCKAIIDAYNHDLQPIFGIDIRSAMVCADPESRDSSPNKYRINHIQRVRNKMDTMVIHDVYFQIAYMVMDKHRVLSVESGEIYAERNEVECILKKLEWKWMLDDFYTKDKSTMLASGRDWAGQFTQFNSEYWFWQLGIIDYDDSYDHNSPMAYFAPKRHVEEGLDVFQSGFAKSEKACKRAIAEALALLILNDVKLHRISELF